MKCAKQNADTSTTAALKRAIAALAAGGTPTVFIEVRRDTPSAELVAPFWVALDLRALDSPLATAYGRRPGDLKALSLNVGAHVTWGPGEEDAGTAYVGSALTMARAGATIEVNLTATHAPSGVLVKSIRLQLDQLLADAVGGRRYFGEALSDAELADEVGDAGA